MTVRDMARFAEPVSVAARLQETAAQSDGLLIPNLVEVGGSGPSGLSVGGAGPGMSVR